MPRRPDIVSFCKWLDVDVPTFASDSDIEDDPLQDCLDAALDYVEERIDPTQLSAGQSLDPATVNYPIAARNAVHLQAARWYKRRTSPEGISTFEGGAIRMTSLDPDIEVLISRIAKVEGFA